VRTRSPLLDDVIFRRLCRVRDRARKNLSEPIRTAALARKASLSTWHFHRLFSLAFGMTPHQFLIEARINRAKELLASGSYSVTDACVAVGYMSLPSFSAKFRLRVGRSPSQYRREVQQVSGVTRASRFTFIPMCLLSRFAEE
jgi:transcriptional regulator GlxA family with amidase domain